MAEDKSFRDYKDEAQHWITMASGEYYPDILPEAVRLYGPVLVEFGRILRSAPSSEELFASIMDSKGWMRIQLCRVFRKYVSPSLPVEMLKRKRDTAKIITDHGDQFRNIVRVHQAFDSRPVGDETLCAILWEYKDRGKKGYDLTEMLFKVLEDHLKGMEIIGPRRAGRDALLGEIFEDYPKPDRPVDFVISDNGVTLAVGLARYDTDRGGAQEDDRTGQYREVAQEVIAYADAHNMPHMKVIFVNDGPGLLTGSMWDDYAYIEEQWPLRAMVLTLRMVQPRISAEWLRS